MFRRISCTDIGLDPGNITSFIKKLERGGNMHALMMMKGDDVFYEAFWAPYKRGSLHRMYSQTKSLNGIAIGMLEHNGLVKLDDPLYSYFPDRIDTELPEALKKQTVRNTLMMCTSTDCPGWFENADRDRVHLYFNSPRIIKPAGTLFSYDSAGSEVLSCLVEKLAGMNSLEYIRAEAFKDTDTFSTARILKVPTGEAWGDSALICTLEDMAAFGRFVMKCSAGNGLGLISPEYIRDAVADLVTTDEDGFFSHKSLGYGYQIWHTLHDGFAFFGMGNQLTICIPKADFLFTCTADDQGNHEARRVLMDALYEHIVEPLLHNATSGLQADSPVCGRLSDSLRELDALTSSLKLRAAEGNASSPIIPMISGSHFRCEPNPMGITEFSLNFSGQKLTFDFETVRGHRSICAGCLENVFDLFPEEGYSDEVGGERAPGHRYRCASSYAFESDNVLALQCRIIDDYLGNLTAFFGFNGDDASVKMVKNAEDFLDEYCGRAVAHRMP